MKKRVRPPEKLPEEQRAIRARCFHPSGTFVEFKKEETEQSIPSRFEQIAAQYPERIAVKSKNQALTYEDLNRAANRIARAVLERSGKGEEPIALLFEKDVHAAAAILGVLKAGKIYIAMDPWFPRERVVSMLNDSQAKLIVTDTSTISRAGALAGDPQRLLNVDDLESSLSGENLGLPISPRAPAYIIYTSGSTGEPKGVIQNHRNVLHHVMNTANVYHICVEDRATLLASFSTGQAVTDVWTTLLNGAALHLWNTKQEGLVGLAKWLVGEEITIYRSSATAFRSFMDTLPEDERFPTIRIVRLGSEPVIWKDFESYGKHFAEHCFLINSLSSTEAMTVCVNVLNKETPVSGNTVPVGYAIEDAEVLLLDEKGETAGMNEIGQIAIRSRYLARGYWRRPDLTRSKFLPDPEGGDERIYLMGDLGRMMPDGCLEHVGREDFQAKVRGYKIETTEVETAIMELENIKAAAVVAREGQSKKETVLVAYLVAKRAPAPSIAGLRRALSEKLPDYMVPSRFVYLEALPLTPNGKVDRRELPAPTPTRPELETPLVSPRSPVERSLAKIWAEVLGVDPIGVHDNFLDLGGHSLMATQIITRVTGQFGVELPLKSLLESPTIAQMARVIVQNQAQEADQEDLAHMLAELEALSDDEAQRALSGKDTI